MLHSSLCQQLFIELKMTQVPSRHSSEEDEGPDLVEPTVQLPDLRPNHGQKFCILQVSLYFRKFTIPDLLFLQ